MIVTLPPVVFGGGHSVVGVPPQKRLSPCPLHIEILLAAENGEEPLLKISRHGQDGVRRGALVGVWIPS